MNIMNLYVYENRGMSNDLSRPLMLENLNVDNVQIHIPKEIDGTDMGTWAWWFVYQNAKMEKYSIPMTLEGTTNDEGEEEYISTVGLNHGFTGKYGTVMYAIEAIQADGSGTVTHEWHTKTYKLEIVYTLQGNQTEYDESESDIISALISRVNELIQSGAEITEIAETIERAAETAQEVIDSIPPDYSALSGQVNTNTAAIALKANQATTYTKTEVDAIIESVDVETDTTLSVSGKPADAKKIGDEISGIKAVLGDLSELETEAKTDIVSAINEAASSGGSGLTAEIKQALLQLASKVAYIDEDGQDYYDDLYNALYPPVHVTGITLSDNSITINTLNSTHTLTANITPANYTDTVSWSSSDNTVATVANGVVTAVGYGTATITVSANGISATCSVTVAQVTLSSINAVYTQSGTVYSNATLDSLKSDLVVTATWSDTSTSTVNAADYTLSGTLTAGTSTITVSYGGQTDTFTVTVTSEWDVDWSYTDGLPTVKGFTLIENDNATASLGNDGLELTITNKDNKIGWDYPTNGTKRVFECEFVLKQNNNVTVCLSEDGTNGVAIRAQYSSNYKGIYLIDAGTIGSMTKLKTITNVNGQYKIKLVVDNGVGAVYIDDVLVADNVDTSAQYYTTHTHFTCTNAATGTANGLLISMKLKLGRTS